MTQPVEILYVVPVGAVIAWYPPPNMTAALPPAFAVCDGEIVKDAESPFDGMPTPNLTNRFPLGAGGSVKPNEQRGCVDYNLEGWNSGPLSTSPTQVAPPVDDQQNLLVVENQGSNGWRYSLTTDHESWNDGNHHHQLNSLAVPAPGWVALVYIMRIK